MKTKTFISTLFIYSFFLLIFHLIRFPLPYVPTSVITLYLPSGEAEAYNETEEGEIPEGEGEYALPLPGVKNKRGKLKRPLPPLPGIGKKEEKKGYEIKGPLSKRRLIRLILPEYPKGGRGRSEVRIKIVVDKEGIVKKIELIKTGGAVFDRAAIEAIREWRFEPSKEDRDVMGIVTIFFEVR